MDKRNFNSQMSKSCGRNCVSLTQV